MVFVLKEFIKLHFDDLKMIYNDFSPFSKMNFHVAPLEIIFRTTVSILTTITLQ